MLFPAVLDGPLPKGNDFMRLIVRQVAARHRMSVAEIMGVSRLAPIATARIEAYALIQASGRFSYPRIGEFFNRDHTTILHGVKKYRALAQQEAA